MRGKSLEGEALKLNHPTTDSEKGEKVFLLRPGPSLLDAGGIRLVSCLVESWKSIPGSLAQINYFILFSYKNFSYPPFFYSGNHSPPLFPA